MIFDKYIGHSLQLYGVTPFTYTDGRAKGVRAFDVRNGNKLEMKVLADRCLDIASLSYKGINLSYLSKCGIVAPEYYSSEGFEWLRSFFVGFLTTCGLRHIGAPCEVDGEKFGLHGRIGNTPAEEVCASIDNLSCDEAVIRIKGIMREARIFQQNLVLIREYIIPVGGKSFTIRNRVENRGFKKEAMMLMLHINFGYPLLCGDSELILDSKTVEPRDEDARKGFYNLKVIDEPKDNYPEQVFFHSLKSAEDGSTSVALINSSLKIGVVLEFNINDFPYLTQWKQFEKCDYVLGLEPSSCKMIGREAHTKSGTLDYLEPGQGKDFDIQVRILDGIEEIDEYKKMRL